MTEPDPEVVQLREQLAAEQQRAEALEKRLIELNRERSRLYNQLDVLRARRHAADLFEELKQLGIDIDGEGPITGAAEQRPRRARLVPKKAISSAAAPSTPDPPP